MHKIRRAVMFAALAVCAFGASASAASAAITVSNPGTLTGSDAGGVTFNATLYGFPVSITCSSANLTGSVSASGAVSVTGASFNTCVDGLGGSVTVTPVLTTAWTGQIMGNTTGHLGKYRVDSLGARVDVTPSFGPVCHYNGGSITTIDETSPASTMQYSSAGPLTSTTTGCGNGTLTGTYNLSKSISISGSL